MRSDSWASISTGCQRIWEKAYSELLTANNELQQDIQKKQKIDDMRKESSRTFILS